MKSIGTEEEEGEAKGLEGRGKYGNKNKNTANLYHKK